MTGKSIKEQGGWEDFEAEWGNRRNGNGRNERNGRMRISQIQRKGLRSKMRERS